MRSYECFKFFCFFLIHCGDDLYHARTFATIGTCNSSMEGATKLKFAPFCSSCDALSNEILFLPNSKFSDFGQKPWTIIRRFGRNRGHSLWSFYSKMEGATKLKFAPFCSSCDALSNEILSPQSQNLHILAKNHGL